MKAKYETALRNAYYDQVVKLYFDQHLSLREISRISTVSKTTVKRWIDIFVNGKQNNHPMPTTKPKKVQSQKPAEEIQRPLSSDVLKLQAQVVELQEQLRKERLRADAFDAMIDIAESTFKLPIRKKSGAKQ